MAILRVLNQPTWLLSRANSRAHKLLVAAFAERGLRPAHYRMLAALAEQGEMSQADLGRELDLDRKDVTVYLDSLVERNLVVRKPDPTDGRRNVVALTVVGAHELPELDWVLAQVQKQVLAPLTAGERKALVELLGKLG